MNEISAGAIIFRKTDKETLFLLLHYPSGHWDFAKGKMEKNELPLETATREIREETGIIDVKFIENFKQEVKYDYTFNGVLIHKKVLMFLAESKTEKINISHEHRDFIWLNYNDSMKKATYENAKSILAKANKLIPKT